MKTVDDPVLEEALEQTFPASDPISMQQALVAGAFSDDADERSAQTRNKKRDRAAKNLSSKVTSPDC